MFDFCIHTLSPLFAKKYRKKKTGMEAEQWLIACNRKKERALPGKNKQTE